MWRSGSDAPSGWKLLQLCALREPRCRCGEVIEITALSLANIGGQRRTHQVREHRRCDRPTRRRRSPLFSMNSGGFRSFVEVGRPSARPQSGSFGPPTKFRELEENLALWDDFDNDQWSAVASVGPFPPIGNSKNLLHPGRHHEENVSTKSSTSEATSRVSPPNADPFGARHHQGTPRQGPQAARGLTRPIESLKSSREFSRVMRAGVRTRSGPVTVVRLPTEIGRSRIGIVAGRRLGGAVTRNRVKRRIREAATRAGLAPSDYVIVPSIEASTVPFEDLVEAIRRGARPERSSE